VKRSLLNLLNANLVHGDIRCALQSEVYVPIGLAMPKKTQYRLVSQESLLANL
jgi:hypothetical protein